MWGVGEDSRKIEIYTVLAVTHKERNGTIASLQTSEDGGYSRDRARAVCEKENAFFHPHGIWGGQKQKLIGRLGRGERDVYTYNV